MDRVLVIFITFNHWVRFGKWRSSGAEVPRRVCDNHDDQDEKDYLLTLFSFHLNHGESEMTQSCLSDDDDNDNRD